MPISTKLMEYLKNEKIHFEIGNHPVAYTAIEVAGKQHVSGKKMVKSVIIKNEEAFFMCVVPAIHLVDFAKLKNTTGIQNLKLADEQELKKLFPDYDLGAEPPFGQLYGLKVYADKILELTDEIVFNAGTHTDVIQMKYQDYKRLVHPIVAEIGTHI